MPEDWAALSDYDVEATAGTLAHRALERWIHARGYLADDPKSALGQAADASLEELGHDAPPRWTLARARLVARGASLAELIGSRPVEEILSEVGLIDPALKLRGRADLLLLGEVIVLLDLKTQTLYGDGIPDSVSFQLNIYAHLIESQYGRLPDRVEVFSLNRGRIPVAITRETIKSALDALKAARRSLGNEARPDPEACFFCERRFDCQAQWDAVHEWAAPDCAEGLVERVETAVNGRAAVLIQGSEGPNWVSGIPAARIAEATVGDQIRVVRMRRTTTTTGTPSTEWRWRAFSDLRFRRDGFPTD